MVKRKRDDNNKDNDNKDSNKDNNNSNNNNNNNNNNDDDNDDDIRKSLPSSGRQVIVILDKANLETVKTKKGEYTLLNSEENISLMRRLKKDPNDYRPDILHQELLSVLDSPLNKAGKVKVYVRTEKNILIEINPKCRIPRTFRRFSSLMVQLLHQLKIRSSDSEMLLRVIKNPVTRYIPAGSKCFGFSQHGTLYSPFSFSKALPDDVPIVLVLGAMAKGSISREDNAYIEEMVSVSEYPLSGSVAINRILGAIEQHWGVM